MGASAFWIRFALAVLATWRVTHLLASENGPADLVVRFRARLGQGLLGNLMDCFQCLSLWIAVPAALYVSRGLLDWLFTWLALSAAACLLERLGSDSAVIEPIARSEEGDVEDVLRSEAVGDAERYHACEEHPGDSARRAKAFIESHGLTGSFPGEPPLLGELANSVSGSCDRPAV